MLEDRPIEQQPVDKSTVDENKDADAAKDGSSSREDIVAATGGGESIKTMIPKKKKLFKQRISLNLGTSSNKSGDGNGVDDSAGATVGGDAGEKDLQQQQLELQKQGDEKDTSMDIDKSNVVDDDTTEKETNEVATASATAESKEGAASALENNNQESQTASASKPPAKKKIKPSATKEDLEATAWTSCYSVAFNKNGSYLASGHASGLVPVHSFASRCLNAVYTPLTSVAIRVKTDDMDNNSKDENYERKPSNEKIIKQEREIKYVNGTTSLSWDNTGQYLMTGAYADTLIRLMDNSHPVVAWECGEITRNTTNLEKKGGKATVGNAGEGETSLDQKILQESDSEAPAIFYWRNGFGEDIPLYLKATSLGKGRLLQSRDKEFSISVRPSPSLQESSTKNKLPNTTVPCVRHSTVLFELPQPLGGPCQFHESYEGIGMARLMDSSLILFHIPPVAFYEMLPGQATSNDNHIEHAHTYSNVDMELCYLLEVEEANMAGNFLYIIPPTPTSETSQASTSTPNYSVICAAFGKGKYDNMLYALTKCGFLLGFEMYPSMISSLQGKGREHQGGDIKPSLVVKIPGCASATQLVVNDRFMLVNTSDALRVYQLADLGKEVELTPQYVFQDPVSKAPWIACDFSSDGEYVVVSTSCFFVVLLAVFSCLNPYNKIFVALFTGWLQLLSTARG